MSNPVVHFEIMTNDSKGLTSFYEDAFGWSFADPAGPVSYQLVQNNGEGIGGGIGTAPHGYQGHVTFYIHVDDVEEAFKRIEGLGGTRMIGPDRVPNGPIIGLFRDPQGNTIGLVH